MQVHPVSIDTYLQQRKAQASQDDSGPWLITFADLMTIMLVFSFVLFMVYQKGAESGFSNSLQSDYFTSFVPLAHANTQNPDVDLNAPILIDNELLNRGRELQHQRIIGKTDVYFPGKFALLTDPGKKELDRIAGLSERNPETKIIVEADMNADHKLSLLRAMRIVNYFSNECGLAKDRLFIQEPDSRNEGQDTITLVGVKLIKSFWGL